MLAVLVVVLSGGSAGAAAGEGDFYVAAGGTLSLLTDIKTVTSDAPVPGATLTLFSDNKTGWGGYAALGRDFGRLRAEVEVGRTENDSDTFTIVSPFMATIPQDGETDIWRYMANVYVDFGGENARLRPYLGAGAGAARVSAFRFAPQRSRRTARSCISTTARRRSPGRRWRAPPCASCRISTSQPNIAGSMPARPISSPTPRRTSPSTSTGISSMSGSGGRFDEPPKAGLR